jgi:hypothetical protein
MATVYLAHDLKHDRDVALKILVDMKDGSAKQLTKSPESETSSW